MVKRLLDRPTGDILVLMIVGTVCLSILAGGATIAVLALTHPEIETTKAVNSVRDVVGTLLGLVSGFLAGRNKWAGYVPGSGGDDENPELDPHL